VQERLYIEVLSCLSEGGFSLDELVVKTKALFEKEGMAGFVSFLLRLLDERISLSLVKDEQFGKWWKRCCESAKLEHYRKVRRRFRTSIGMIRINWWRLRCVRCGKSKVPLREFLGLKRYQSKSLELEKMVVEVVSEQSYRRSSSHLETIGMIPVPKSTAHRWVMRSESDELD
jgi:hypothetical protein